MIAFEHEFKNLDEEHERDLFNLEREGAVYTDQWVDELQDFRHVRIPLQPAEIKEYVRSLKAWDLFLGSGEKWARDVEGIPADVAEMPNRYGVTQNSSYLFLQNSISSDFSLYFIRK